MCERYGCWTVGAGSFFAGCLQLLEIFWNFIDAPGKFDSQPKCDSMPITEPNLVTSLNPRNCRLTTFCAVLFIMSCVAES